MGAVAGRGRGFGFVRRQFEEDWQAGNIGATLREIGLQPFFVAPEGFLGRFQIVRGAGDGAADAREDEMPAVLRNGFALDLDLALQRAAQRSGQGRHLEHITLAGNALGDPLSPEAGKAWNKAEQILLAG